MKHHSPPHSAPTFRAGWDRLPVPRVSGRSDSPALFLGAVLLLLLATFGAALVHLVEYHLGLGTGGAWCASALAMLAGCPLSGVVLIVLIVCVTTAGALLWEMRALNRQRAALARKAAWAGLPEHAVTAIVPRQRGRFVHLLIAVLLIQASIYTLADRLWSMGTLMRMDGTLMLMQTHGAIPLVPLHLAVSILLSAGIWRLERRLTILRACIAKVCRLLPLFLARICPLALSTGAAALRLRAPVIPALLSRPPPA